MALYARRVSNGIEIRQDPAEGWILVVEIRPVVGPNQRLVGPRFTDDGTTITAIWDLIEVDDLRERLVPVVWDALARKLHLSDGFDLQGFLGRLRLPQPISLGGLVTLTNVGTSYDAIPASKGLGTAIIDFDDVTSLRFGVFVNKVGSGTQSWQLWNETDGAEIAVIDDSAVAGTKALSVVVTSGLPTGVKQIRVRAKSTIGADDPVYYGAALLLS
jgi:hypothetical protein